jgi:hypothetical protein
MIRELIRIYDDSRIGFGVLMALGLGATEAMQCLYAVHSRVNLGRPQEEG